MGTKRFEGVEFRKEYPAESVADHHVLMAFNRDQDAIDWRQWWDEEGAKVFREWLLRRKV
jgi:hypothetical protein